MTERATVQTPERGRLLSFAQALEYLGAMPERRLRRLVAAKKIPHYYDGRLFFLSGELDAWLARCRRPAVDEAKSKHIELAKAKATGAVGIEDLMPKKRRLSGTP